MKTPSSIKSSSSTASEHLVEGLSDETPTQRRDKITNEELYDKNERNTREDQNDDDMKEVNLNYAKEKAINSQISLWSEDVGDRSHITSTSEMKEKWNIKSSHSSKSTSQSGEELDGEPPIDKLKIVYSIVLLHGIVVLLPWNMFITIAPNYYVNYWFTVDGNKTSYAKSFMSALGITAQIPNFSMSLISVMQIIGGSLMFRIAGPLALNCLNVAVILALVIFQDPNVDAMQWFYIVSLAIAMLMNASNGLYQNSIYGLAADFPPAYTNALMVGNNVCGTFISILSIVETICFPHNYKTVAIIYFSISLAVLVLCEILLLLLTRLDFYKYYVLKGQKSRLDQRTTRPSLSQFLEAFKMCWMQLLSVFLVFFVSLAVFPTVLVGTVPNKKGEPWNSAISRDLYPGVTTFLNFNLMAAIGSTLASFIQFPGPDKLLVVAMARLLFIPYFMLCNYNVDDRVMPVFFENEWFFIIGNTIMAFTSGYYSSLGMMYAPKVVPDSLSKTAGMAAALCIVTGVMVGVAFTPVITTMVNNIG